MNGLRAILQTNNTTAPINGAAYGSTDLIRDTLQAARQNGGEPDLLVVSTNFMSRLRDLGAGHSARTGGRDRLRHADQCARGPVPARRDDRRSTSPAAIYRDRADAPARSTSATSGTLTGTCAAIAATWSRATGSPRWRSRSSTKAITRGSRASRRSARTDTSRHSGQATSLPPLWGKVDRYSGTDGGMRDHGGLSRNL